MIDLDTGNNKELFNRIMDEGVKRLLLECDPVVNLNIDLAATRNDVEIIDVIVDNDLRVYIKNDDDTKYLSTRCAYDSQDRFLLEFDPTDIDLILENKEAVLNFINVLRGD